MTDIPTHHMIYGYCTDYITGETLVDTDDERYRQELARAMVEEKGWAKEDVEMRLNIDTLFNKQFVASKITLTLSLNGKRCLVIRYAPGSLVTRERSAVAAARVLDATCQIPLAVVTNGRDAELLDTYSGAVLGKGLDAIPTKEEVRQMVDGLRFEPYDEAKRERELRVLNAFDVEICCAGAPCALPNVKEG
ncbi:MAG: type I restriction enzyme HsdR N-terminal domain-containing protein [Proteobacteria bacterium]|nr:type I restriction enzyme HsdR N-terminal domain-containing protein [Pseudomonadota bacterium]MBU1639876.1 type I restriction enzyme HsdR N-terminal domain-containing protein [Pseudomonadota bacterium]